MEFVLTSSPEFFKNNSKSEEWTKHQIEFIRKEWGDNCKLAVVHKDKLQNIFML